MLLLEEAIIEKLRGGPCCFDEIAHQRTPVWMDEAMSTCLLLSWLQPSDNVSINLHGFDPSIHFHSQLALHDAPPKILSLISTRFLDRPFSHFIPDPFVC